MRNIMKHERCENCKHFRGETPREWNICELHLNYVPYKESWCKDFELKGVGQCQ